MKITKSILAILCLFLFSCKKEIKLPLEQSMTKKTNHEIEQAFPKLKGEWLTIKWKNQEIKVEKKETIMFG